MVEDLPTHHFSDLHQVISDSGSMDHHRLQRMQDSHSSICLRIACSHEILQLATLQIYINNFLMKPVCTEFRLVLTS